jgi:two-component system phosphate regulon sensor histidine kinase PhoR
LSRSLEIRVSDQGPGIPKRERTRIFDAFYQIDHSHTRKRSGAGIGLSIVRHLVEAHGGSVAVDEAQGGGAAFVVRLPVFTGMESVRVRARPESQ